MKKLISLTKNREKYMVDGFMGRTHALLSTSLFLVILMLPIDEVQIFFNKINSNLLLFFICLTVLVGGALFPDLDNDKSSAGSTLGIFGSVITLFMKSTSSIVWNLYRTKKDQKPNSQHRYLWHQPFVYILLGILFYFYLPNGNYTILANLQTSMVLKMFPEFIRTNSVLLLFMILSFASILVGSNMIIYNLSKYFPIPFYAKYIYPCVILFYTLTTNYTNLRIISICFCIGALLHVIEDAFCDTGVPGFIFPIPQFWRNRIWGRITLIPIPITTGGVINNIIDVICLVSVAVLSFIYFSGTWRNL